MIPRFRLERPSTVEGALAAHAKHPQDSAYLAGGTELLQVMKMGLMQVDRLIDLKSLPDLRRIVASADGLVEIGALATHREIERSPVVASYLPDLAALEGRIANPRVRATGTIGGNLAFAEPHSDPATFLVACGAIVELVGIGGTRTLPAESLIIGPLTTARAPDEILRTIRIPGSAPGEGRAFERFAFFERPTASVAVSVIVRGGRIAGATVVVGSVTDLPTRLVATGQVLVGRAVTELDDILARIERDPPDVIDAFTDHSGSADHKRHLAWRLVARAARRAAGLLAA